jgi:hypothetical protein
MLKAEAAGVYAPAFIFLLAASSLLSVLYLR